MLSRWTQHLSDEKEKKDFEKYLRGSRDLLDRMKAILGEMENELDRSETNPESYDTPNWDYKQAHKNGARMVLNRVKRLVDLDQQIITIRD